ncbi:MULTISPECIES: hypothetical protein [Acetobacterales]|uniref:hypothetical protein n=1 Tax=Roseomonas sp. WGS1072 TaxID=3366816 RepID=UPI003BF08954
MPLAPPRNRTCLLLISHLLDEVVLARFWQCQAELGHALDVVLVLTEPLQEKAEQYALAGAVFLRKSDLFIPDYPRKTVRPFVKPGNADLIPLAIWRQAPDYEAYWVMEFDVCAPRGLPRLLAVEAGSGADLLGSYLRRREQHPDWVHWPTLTFRDAGPETVEEARIRAAASACFLPLSRYSGRLMAALDAAYRGGWNGHHEVVIPTLARSLDMVLEDLNTVARRVLDAPIYSPEGFNHERARPMGPLEFYHPVKSPRQIAALHQGLLPMPAAAE